MAELNTRPLVDNIQRARDDVKMDSSIRVFVRNLDGRSVACDIDSDSATVDLLEILEVGLLLIPLPQI